eukprot:comp12809_c0_seq1/m.7955 comp12809_c0_seq1/g.7955  ORF comp12809_c0_seq1/g.7955 comp12809_c0_seq1/m.7955 type:complete len:365 (+) comp12809_c0_seq1:1096-2190(+)
MFCFTRIAVMLAVRVVSSCPFTFCSLFSVSLPFSFPSFDPSSLTPSFALLWFLFRSVLSTFSSCVSATFSFVLAVSLHCVFVWLVLSLFISALSTSIGEASVLGSKESASTIPVSDPISPLPFCLSMTLLVGAPSFLAPASPSFPSFVSLFWSSVTSCPSPSLPPSSPESTSSLPLLSPSSLLSPFPSLSSVGSGCVTLVPALCLCTFLAIFLFSSATLFCWCLLSLLGVGGWLGASVLVCPPFLARLLAINLSRALPPFMVWLSDGMGTERSRNTSLVRETMPQSRQVTVLTSCPPKIELTNVSRSAPASFMTFFFHGSILSISGFALGSMPYICSIALFRRFSSSVCMPSSRYRSNSWLSCC